jgi:hypothetical protein
VAAGVNGLNAGTLPIYAGYYSARVGLAPDSPEFDAYPRNRLRSGKIPPTRPTRLNFARCWLLSPFPEP